MRYCLADYIMSIEPSDSRLKQMFSKVTVGGDGNALSSITLSLSDTLWSTTSFATGAWVHNKNLSKVGSAEIRISQLSSVVVKLKQMCKVYYSGNYSGFTISVTDSNGTVVATANDCYPTKIPDQSFGETASEQSWSFTCGEVDFK